jgi:hypothetical protein
MGMLICYKMSTNLRSTRRIATRKGRLRKSTKEQGHERTNVNLFRRRNSRVRQSDANGER